MNLMPKSIGLSFRKRPINDRVCIWRLSAILRRRNTRTTPFRKQENPPRLKMNWNNIPIGIFAQKLQKV